MRHGRSAADGLTGKVVPVTGGARGIGLATVDAFLDAGATVVIGDVDETRARDAASVRGDRVSGVALDVTDSTSFGEFFTAAARLSGSVDVLVNNAGIMPTGSLLEEPDTLTERILAVNLTGVITGCRLAGRRMRDDGGGTIVNVASLAGLFGAPALATYCATKFGVVGLTEALQKEFRPYGVHVAAVLPAVVGTDLSAGARYPRWIKPFIEVEPDEVAAAIVRVALTRGPTRTVPMALGLPVRASRLLRTPIRNALEKRAGLDTAYTQADPAVRSVYHRRIAASRD